MEILIAIVLFIGFGILISRASAFIGSKIFRFSDIFRYFFKLIKKTE